MSDVCANPLSPVVHDGPGGDQFCVFCLRKYGDDATLRAATLTRELADVRAELRRTLDNLKLVIDQRNAAFRQYDDTRAADV